MATKMKPMPKPMMAMKGKAKRYADGGEVEDDAAAPEPRMGSKMNNTIEKGQSFKEAFAAARKSGGKTFTWNGKSYSTAMASDKPTAKASAQSTADKGAYYSKLSSALRTAPEGAGKRELANQTAKALADYEGERETKTGKMREALRNAPEGEGKRVLAAQLATGRYAKGGLVKPKAAPKAPTMAIGKTKGKTDMGMMKAMKGKATGMACGGKVKKMASGGMAKKGKK